jgi:hypothetical protein
MCRVRRKFYGQASLALLPFLLGMPVLAGPINYVTNGEFETGATEGVLTPDGGIIYVFGVGGATDVGGWTVSDSGNNNASSTPLSLVVTGDPPQQPASGSYALDFDPYWDIATGAILGWVVTGTLPEISQTFSLPAGDYVLSFDGALESPTPAGSSRTLNVTLTGAASLDQAVTADQGDDIGYTGLHVRFRHDRR